MYLLDVVFDWQVVPLDELDDGEIFAEIEEQKFYIKANACNLSYYITGQINCVDLTEGKLESLNKDTAVCRIKKATVSS
jgi:hypothetical protein